MKFKKIFLICIILVGMVVFFRYFKTEANQEISKEPQIQERPKITHIGPISPDIISITLTEGRVEYGKQVPYKQEKGDVISPEGINLWLVRNGKPIGSLAGRAEKYIMTFDRLEGGKVDTALIDKPENYTISSPDDPDLSGGRQPYAVFRKTKPIDYARIGATFEAPLEHTLYFKLLKPLKVGKQYTIEFKGIDLPKQTFTYDPSKMRSEAVHVSHIGFRPDDPSKTAFLSLWMGSGGPIEFKEKTPFFVIDDKSGDVAYKGEIKISKKLFEKDEDAYGHNFNGVNVYIMDFSAFQKQGKYRVYVDEVGCSYPFDIADDAWSKAFNVSARGLYHQRSGIELGPPYTTFKRPRNFYPDDGVKVFASTVPLMDTFNGFAERGDDFAKFARGRTSELVPSAWGGYCDAGDWDRRIQHLSAARFLFELFEFSPKYFEKLDLNIPGSKEDYPDIIREALWGVDFYHRLQTKEGGVRGGIESEDHPRYGETSWQDSLMVMAYAPDVWSSYLYAATAAYASYVLKKFNYKNSEVYHESAVRAMDWSEEELKKSKIKYPHQINDARNLAAAELFKLTGAKKWHDLFLETTAFKGQEELLYKSKNHDQSDAAWVYYRTDKTGTDKNIKMKCRNAIIKDADFLMNAQQKTGFKWAKSPWRPAYAGQFTTPDCISIVRAHVMTGKKEYLQAIILSTQTGAGANPINISYTTGLGHKSPLHAMHFDSRITHQLPPPGITVLGPLNPETVGGFESPLHKIAGKFCYPDVKKWPDIENYWDVFWYPTMCEFTVHQSIVPNAYIWGYLAARK